MPPEFEVTIIDKNLFTISCKLVKILEFVKFISDSNLRIIGKNAFYNAQMLSIDIPKDVMQISDGAFDSAKNLAIINFHDPELKKNPIYSDSDVKSVQFNCQNAIIKIIDPSLEMYDEFSDEKESNSEEESESELESNLISN